MVQRLKIALILSVVLNTILIVGILWARMYIRRTSFELAALNSEAQANFAKFVLTEIESGDATRIQTLKKQLTAQIEQGHSKAELWRSAA